MQIEVKRARSRYKLVLHQPECTRCYLVVESAHWISFLGSWVAMFIRNLEVPTCGGCDLRDGCQTGFLCFGHKGNWVGLSPAIAENQMETWISWNYCLYWLCASIVSLCTGFCLGSVKQDGIVDPAHSSSCSRYVCPYISRFILTSSCARVVVFFHTIDIVTTNDNKIIKIWDYILESVIQLLRDIYPMPPSPCTTHCYRS